MLDLLYKIIAIICSIILLFCSCVHNSAIDDIEVERIDKLDICSEYMIVLNEYLSLVDNLFLDSFEDDVNWGRYKSPEPELQYEWQCMVIDAKEGLINKSTSSFGYALKDINSDNKEELILLRDDYYFLAIFTIEANKAKLLDAFWYKHKGMILESGELFTLTISGSDYYEYNVKLLNPENNELSVIRKLVREDTLCYEFTSQGKTFLEKNSFDMMVSQYPNISSDEKKTYMVSNGIDFVSIETIRDR